MGRSVKPLLLPDPAPFRLDRFGAFAYFPPMPIVWDSPLAAAVARELNARLAGSRLRAHRFDWDARELTLWFRTATLRWALHPSRGWVLLHPPEDPHPMARPLAARVQAVEAPPDERRVQLRLEKVRGSVREVTLVLELMTNQWNALLLEEGTIRHLLWTRRTDERTLSVGHPYAPPPPSSRKGIDPPLRPEEWEGLIGEGAGRPDPAALLEGLAFTSSLNLPTLFPEESSRRREGGPLTLGYELWRRLRDLDDPRPCILESTSIHQPYPYPLFGFAITSLDSILGGMEEVAGGSEGPGSAPLDVARERLERALERARRKVRGLQREMASGGEADLLRDRANLLLARLREVPRGKGRVTLRGFGGEPVEVEMDPARSPQENAQALYQEAGRLDRARARLPALMAEAKAKVEELERMAEGLAAGTLDPEAGTGELGEETPTDRRGAKGDRPPFRRYWSSGGLEIRVGRSSRENDTLTFRHARPDDVWLHARDAAGAHVILRWEREEPPPARDLEEAAVLAALGSRARSSGVVPVDWTRRKYVRKPRRAPPGAVIPERVKTVFVEPDPDLPGRLRRPREE